MDSLKRLAIRVTLLGVVTLACTGCIKVAANVLNLINGEHLVKAAYDGLEGRRVAVVCEVVGGDGPYSPGETIALRVSKHLKKNIEEIDLISYQDVSDWKDRNDWDGVDYREIGRGLRADVVVAIDVRQFSIFESTFLKGKARVTTKVIDMTKGGEVVWDDDLDDFEYPANAPIPTTEKSEGVFRRELLEALSHRLAKRFYAHEVYDDLKYDETYVR